MRALVRTCFVLSSVFVLSLSTRDVPPHSVADMYFDAPVTDFDSEDTERSLANDDYPSRDSNVSDNRSSNSININNNVPALRSQLCRVYEFGEFEDNYGWIQCRSKSYPDRMYYHNTRSGCNTWYRPISRYIDIPVVSVGRAYHADDPLESAQDLELMSVSDDERKPDASGQVPARDHDRSLMDVPDIIARYYYTPQVNLISNTDDSCNSSDASEHYERKEREANVEDENNNVSDSINSPLYVTSFLETEFLEGEGVVDIEGTNRMFNTPLRDNASNVPRYRAGRVVYGVPRLKRIGPQSQLIKPRRTRVTKTREESGPRKIICDMYGVRTINYNLPEPEQVLAAAGVKMSTLSASDSDSDTNVPPLKTTRSFESEWHDIEKNLHQPLLSDSSSSPSSSTSRSTSSSSSSCSCSSCSSSSKKA